MKKEDLLIFPVQAFTDNYIWILTNAGMKQAIIVDPGDAAPVISALEASNTQPVAILLTHHHQDHSGGIVGLREYYGYIPIYAGKESRVALVNHFVDTPFSITINNKSIQFEVIDIPGHTLDHVAFYSKGHVFCGDTLFAAGCGRVFEGTHDQLFQSLKILSTLPDETLMYCGHEYTVNNLRFAHQAEPSNNDILKRLSSVEALRALKKPSLPSTLSQEKLTNPFLRCHISEIIHTVQQRFNVLTTVDKEIFYWLRTWKDQFRL